MKPRRPFAVESSTGVSIRPLYSTLHYSTVQHSTVQYSTVQYSAVQDHTFVDEAAYQHQQHRHRVGAPEEVRGAGVHNLTNHRSVL